MKKLLHKLERPTHCLRRPGRDAVWKVEKSGGAVARRDWPAILQDRAAIEREHAAKALEERGFTRPVGADEAEDLPLANREGHVVERGQTSVPLGEIRRL